MKVSSPYHCLSPSAQIPGVVPLSPAAHLVFSMGSPPTALDLQNPDNLGQQSTDNGVLPNLKWSFSDSRTRILRGGWVREQVITDLPVSVDISAAQQHLTKGSIRELHWHRTAECGYVYAGSVLLSAVNEDGQYQVSKLEVGDIWYFPKGEAHTVQGLEEENEFLLVFDDGNFDAVVSTFNLDDWIAYTPVSVLAKNFNLSESVFGNVPSPNPYIQNATLNPQDYVYYAKDHPLEKVPGRGGALRMVDTTTFPIATTIAATVVTLEPAGLRELHWHPNAAEWLYFHKGQARAGVFIGNANARTFDFSAGDTALFPDNNGEDIYTYSYRHYIENTSPMEQLVWIEIYKSDRPTLLRIPLDVAKSIKTEKQILIK
ncbi:Bicupin- oxalate decarboxylase/oxidase [Apiospora phragmitis]|uniref:Bicupin- oxalate decarboxylase/oxidase n=1 Tax=Apiospora phragmitis TaxID=2905665 RepID=A0ABR1VZ33_9PEZI